MQKNVNVGAGRQSHITPNGTYLERKYIYLLPSLWDSLHQISRSSGLSASEYLASILSAAIVGQSKGNNQCPNSH